MVLFQALTLPVKGGIRSGGAITCRGSRFVDFRSPLHNIGCFCLQFRPVAAIPFFPSLLGAPMDISTFVGIEIVGLVAGHLRIRTLESPGLFCLSCPIDVPIVEVCLLPVDIEVPLIDVDIPRIDIDVPVDHDVGLMVTVVGIWPIV